MDDKNILTECTGNCYTCGSSCESADGERRSKSFFDRLEDISEKFDEVGEDELINMLNTIVSELENEDGEDAKA